MYPPYLRKVVGGSLSLTICFLVAMVGLYPGMANAQGIEVGVDIQATGDGILSETTTIEAAPGDNIVIEIFATGYSNAQGAEISLEADNIAAISGDPQGSAPAFPIAINSVTGNIIKLAAVSFGAPQSQSGPLYFIGNHYAYACC